VDCVSNPLDLSIPQTLNLGDIHRTTYGALEHCFIEAARINLVSV